MVGWTDVLIVTLLAIGATVLVGILGYLIERSDSSTERGEPAELRGPAERREFEKR
jgi:hypothetical protein